MQLPETASTLQVSALNRLRQHLDAIVQALGVTPQGSDALNLRLQNLIDHATALEAETHSIIGNAGDSELLVWARAIQTNVAGYRGEINALTPWVTMDVPDSLRTDLQWTNLCETNSSLGDLAIKCRRLSIIANAHGDGTFSSIKINLEKAAQVAEDLVRRLHAISDRAKSMFDAMDFGFLFDTDRELLSIGYRCEDACLDANFYDLLASEARLASFIAIAKGDVPAKHWYRLGRRLTPIDGSSGLISWSGSMFEYLMPSLVMRAPAGSLLAHTNTLIVWRQQNYAQVLGFPWGISESEYNVRDIEQTYQYSSFGIPDLGYKRGLGDNLVVAPYASALASMIDPAAAALNFEIMKQSGACGRYGWYEALDYTRSRVADGASFVIVRAFMAHHQAMAIVAIGNTLHDSRMCARFHAEPIIRATELLLQERMPRDFAVARTPSELTSMPEEPAASILPDNERRYSSAHSRAPRTHLLSNGRMSTMITAAGSGYTRWKDVAISRWREDTTCDDRGAYVFIRDVKNGVTWSAGFQPMIVEPDAYAVAFSESAARIARIDGGITTETSVLVSPEDDAEIRRISLTNNGRRELTVDVTSFVEIALARQADDQAHPAFASLFVETEFVPQLGALLATRRQRSDADPLVWAAHLSVVEGECTAEVQFETDRVRFIGRGRTVHAPLAVNNGWPLSNTTGAVLDPIFSLRRQVRLPAGATIRVSFWTLAAASRAEVLALADKHHDPSAFDRAVTLAWTQAQMQLHHLGIGSDEAHRFQRLAGQILFSDPAMRASAAVITKGSNKPSALWVEGISGDRPIILVWVAEDGHLELVRQVLRAQEYWRLKQLAVDLVIINEHKASYVEGIQANLAMLVRMHQPAPVMLDTRTTGGIFLLRADLTSAAVCAALCSCARAVLYGDRGSFADQLRRISDTDDHATAKRKYHAAIAPAGMPLLPHSELEFYNGLGGFADDGRDYMVILDGDRTTPLPWINVVANPSFWFQVSAEGSGFTWAGNSQQNQLTAWSNDPVCDPGGEAIYVRDEEADLLWGPTALPIRETATPYKVRHGQGYSRFEHTAHGIALDLVQYVSITDPIKISRLGIINQSNRMRSLSVTAYIEWVLGQGRAANAPSIVTTIDPITGAIFAHNHWNDRFGDHIAFADLSGQQIALTGDRTEFLGRDGRMDCPHGLAAGVHLSNRVGAGLDPCAALQTKLLLAPGASAQIVFFLGQSPTIGAAQELIAKYRSADLDAVLGAVTDHWNSILNVVQIKTPDRGLDILINRWLPYQTLGCRVWARSAFYQSSGAYGFRDQLQDVLALCLSRPDIARAHLLRAASRQFKEGDVQHWWLPESGQGVRTRVSDDCAWLAYCVAHYVNVTGDAAVLDEIVPFIEGRNLDDTERDAFFQPTVSEGGSSLFDHCALALDKSLLTGVHGLPLIGTGDWNDGMDAIGALGKGESIWLGWFLFKALTDFALCAEQRHALVKAQRWREHAAGLKQALNDAGWDGDWYRRAYFDDGSALGSVGDNACLIDSIAQSWAVISGAGDPTRAARAMAALDKYLIHRDDCLVLLFEPPFDRPLRNPGYIKGYPPGVRENGGQYTHAAAWATLAFVMQGDDSGASRPSFRNEAAQPFRDYSAHCSDLMSPTIPG